MSDMPYEVKRNMDALYQRIAEIHQAYREQAIKEVEPMVKAIVKIKNMYPEPLLLDEARAAALFKEFTK